MSEFLIPRDLKWQFHDVRPGSNAAVSQNPFGVGVNSIARPGGLYTGALTFRNQGGTKRTRLETLLGDMRGPTNRFWFNDLTYTKGGSFSVSELIATPTFESGIGAWNTSVAATAIRQDGHFLKVDANEGSGRVIRPKTGGTTVTVATAYAVRTCVLYPTVAPVVFGLEVGNSDSNGDYVNKTLATSGLHSALIVPTTTSVFPHLNTESAGNQPPRKHGYVSLFQFARCAVVDNRGNNFLHAQAFDNSGSWSAIRSTVTANDATGPSAGTTADKLVEDTSTNISHYITQVVTKAAAVETWCLTVWASPDERSEIQLRIADPGLDDEVRAFFDLSAGTVGLVDTGGTGANARAFIEPAAGNYFKCSVVGTVNAETSLNGLILLSSGSETISYTGDGSSGLHLWGAHLRKSEFPVGYVNTTTAIVASDQQTGPVLRTKGWPVSTNGLLLEGDYVDFAGEYHRVQRNLDSDAFGNAYLHVSPDIRVAPADDTPIWILDPMIRALTPLNSIAVPTRIPKVADADIPFVEATS